MVMVSPVLETRGRVHLTNVAVAAGRRGVSFHFAQEAVSRDPSAEFAVQNWPLLLSSALLTLSFNSCVYLCFPCDIGSGNNFPPREKLVVHDAPRMNFQVSASGGAEAVVGGV